MQCSVHPNLIKIANTLLRNRKHPSSLSPLVLMTDPDSALDPLDISNKLPKGSAIIYRHFGAVDKLIKAKTLRHATRERGQQFLIGNDPELAIEVEADGVHFRRDEALVAPTVWRKHHPEWLITMAGIKGNYVEYTAPLDCLDGLFISSVFKSKSPSSGTPMGLKKFNTLCQKLDVAVFALGGVNSETVKTLDNSYAAGLSGIREIIDLESDK